MIKGVCTWVEVMIKGVCTWVQVMIKGVCTWMEVMIKGCLLYTSPSPRDEESSRMPSSA